MKKLSIGIYILSVFCLNFLFSEAYASAPLNRDFLNANELYQQEKYKDAVSAYERLLQSNLESANIYFNLGNAYFKSGTKGKAILNYERALRLLPGDADIKRNLEHVNSLIIDRSIQKYSPGFTALYNMLLNNFSADNLAISLFLFNILAFALLSIFVLRGGASRILLYAASLAIVVFLVNFGLLINKPELNKKRIQAIVLKEEVGSLFAPNKNSAEHFKLYEGSKIAVLEYNDTWSKIKRFDGKIGWVDKNNYEKI